eukprot:c9966_g1_i2.p1 GENE.c9966_g1_i2~~c9966_g1_i2.p1  ORF type:complete len:1235 (+),score=329.41 c9966_g1_i2:37-3741(+)
MNPSVTTMLEKMNSEDRDFRYMAVSDLAQEFEKRSVRLDGNLENKITSQLLKLLEDKSADVQGLTVQCIGSYLPVASESTVNKVIGDLLTNVLQTSKGGEAKRDISVLALKTAVPCLPQTESSVPIIRKNLPAILSALNSQISVETKMECLEVVQGIAQRFPQQVAVEHGRMFEILFPLLSSDRSVLRKRVISCLATISPSLSIDLFDKLIQHSIATIEGGNPKQVKTSMQLIVALSSIAGHRFSSHVNKLVELMMKHLANPPEEVDEDISEMIESCLSALQSFTQRCPKEMENHISVVSDVALRYLKFDPNYVDDDDGNDPMSEDEPSDNDNEYDEGSDDPGDGSWKIRRAACKVISAVIFGRPDKLSQFGGSFASALLARFSEREESVRLDVFNTFVDLVRQSLNLSTVYNGDQKLTQILTSHLDVAVKAISKQLRDKSVKVRCGVFVVAAELCRVRSGDELWVIQPAVLSAEHVLADKNSQSALKIDALRFLNAFFRHIRHGTHFQYAQQLHTILQSLVPTLSKTIKERYFKISVLALDLAFEIVHTLYHFNMDASTFLVPLYDVVLANFAVMEQDSEIKGRAMLCMGALIALFGQQLGSDRLGHVLPILLERLNNEIIRVSALKAFAEILSSKLPLDLSSVLVPLSRELSGLLRQSNQHIKHAAISCLISLVTYHHSALSGEQFDVIVRESAQLISDSDSHMTALALQVALAVLQTRKGDGVEAIQSQVMPKLLLLIKSPLLQGQALDYALQLLSCLATINHPSYPFDTILTALMSTYQDEQTLPRLSLQNISQCIAHLTFPTSPDVRNAMVQKVMSQVTSPSETVTVVSLLTLGKLGRLVDLTDNAELVPVFLGLFESQKEEVKIAASFALGSVAVGNMERLVPVILEQLEQRSHLQYLLLHSLKEVITAEQDVSQAHIISVQTVLPMLFTHANNQEEGVRNAVAECLGGLAVLQPALVVAELTSHITPETNENVKSTVVTALKSTMITSNAEANAIIEPTLPDFLALVTDPSLSVRRSALLTFNATIHHKAKVAVSVTHLFPAIYRETVKRPELIRQVQLGPFKHTIDDGLPVRKAALECLDTLFDKAWHLIDLNEVVKNLSEGVDDDDHGIKMLTYHLLIKIAFNTSTSHCLLSVLDKLTGAIQKRLSAKLRDNAVQQEIEQHNELSRAVLRLAFAFTKLPSAEGRLTSVIDSIKQSPILTPLWNDITAESRAMTRRSSSTVLVVDL